MEHCEKTPVYTIGIAAKFLGVCPATLRIWERKGLIRPNRLGKNRFYSQCDIDRLNRIKELIQSRGINIEGVKSILNTARCWEVKKCSPAQKKNCPAYQRIGNA